MITCKECCPRHLIGSPAPDCGPIETAADRLREIAAYLETNSLTQHASLGVVAFLRLPREVWARLPASRDTPYWSQNQGAWVKDVGPDGSCMATWKPDTLSIPAMPVVEETVDVAP